MELQGRNREIMTCISAAPSNEKVIRAAAEMAAFFQDGFTALFVENGYSDQMDSASRERLRKNLKTAEELGAKIVTVYGNDIAAQIAEYANASGITKVVVGRMNHRQPLWMRLFSGRDGLEAQLGKLAPELEIYVIPDNQPEYRPDYRNRAKRMTAVKEAITVSAADFGKMLLVLTFLSLLGWLFYSIGFGEINIIPLYILGALFTAIWTSGAGVSALYAFFSVVTFNFLFTVPRFTLRAYDASYPITFLVMLFASFLISSLTGRVKEQTRLAVQKAYRTEVLLETSQMLQKAKERQEILDTAAGQLYRLLERPVWVYEMGEGKEIPEPKQYPERQIGETGGKLSREEEQAIAWVREEGKPAGACTAQYAEAKYMYLPVRGQKKVLAVVGIAMDHYPEPGAFEKNLMIAMVDECGLVLEKELLNMEKQEIQARAKQEALRANLLRAISHDLRTPLTSIMGNSAILMESPVRLEERKKQAIYTEIYDDAKWLVSLVENLLSVTRIENGTMRMKREPELLEEIFQEASSHLDRKAGEHQITICPPEDLLLVKADAGLIVQVLVNLINNAVKYTQPGSVIRVWAEREPMEPGQVEPGQPEAALESSVPMVRIFVSDNGPGIRDEEKPRIFDMFYTVGNTRGDGRRGLGLGLSLCKSIVKAHGGSIEVKDNQPEGTVFSFTLEEAETAGLYGD
ncbi:MAG: DUF4118 domain-containing protein [Lachnospiraceae bacterium]|nr:DUF4118 domain-containing protein [Lachnospiraceae bacterium]